jgi:hypothetical protein
MVIESVLVCAAVFALLTLAFPGAAGVQVIAVAAVCVTAGLPALQSLSDGHYGWFSAFLAMAVLLNPLGLVSLTSTPTLALLGIGLAILTSWITMVRGALPSRSIAQRGRYTRGWVRLGFVSRHRPDRTSHRWPRGAARATRPRLRVFGDHTERVGDAS